VSVQVPGLTGVTAIAAGWLAGYALRRDGSVWAWGNGGPLGDGDTDSSSVPVRVTGLTDVTVIAGGLGAAYALRGDGTVWAWGMGGAGRLGNGSTESSSVPVQVSGLTDATAIAAGGGYYVTLLGGAAAYALRTDGTVMAWGTSQQLGNGATANSSVPVPVSGLAGVTVIAAGPFNGYAVTG